MPDRKYNLQIHVETHRQFLHRHKTQDMIKKRINSGHINGLRAFWNRKSKVHTELCINTSFIFNQSPAPPTTPPYYDSQNENMHRNSQIVPPAPTNQTQSPSQTGFDYLTEPFTNHLVSPKNQCSNDENGPNFENSQL